MASQEVNERSSTPVPDDPVKFLNDGRFNQTFTLPAGPNRPDPFQVTYSDYGYRDLENPEREHVLLFCGPLMSSRHLHIAKDALAKKHRVRIINPDRPGFGGTTSVPAADRVRVWLEIVPALLRHLGIRHVSVASHSAGTIYALNTLLYLRRILSPTRPAAVSGMMPGFRAVSGLLPALQTSPTPPVAEASASRRMARFEEEIWQQIIKKVYAENVQGLSEEAILLLKRAEHPECWGAWGDHDRFVTLLAEGEGNLDVGVVSDAL
ncbi:interferon-induced GTP-binding protein mx2 [Colletotrichum incanum]|nr:interferon-induced GTP-binding protein mx2 [Colletotrichum incanum]